MYPGAIEPYQVRVKGRPRIVPAGPRTIKVLGQWGRRVDKVVGYNTQPYIEIYTDPGGLRSIDPRWVRLLPSVASTTRVKRRRRPAK